MGIAERRVCVALQLSDTTIQSWCYTGMNYKPSREDGQVSTLN